MDIKHPGYTPSAPLKMEIHNLERSNHSLDISNQALVKMNSELHTINQTERAQLRERRERGAAVPKEFRHGKESERLPKLKLFGGHEDDKVDGKEKEKLGERSAGRETVPDVPFGSVVCDAKGGDSKPKRLGDGTYESMKCGPDGKPTERTTFGVDGKTRIDQTKWNADGSYVNRTFTDDGKSLLFSEKVNADRSSAGTLFEPDGKTPIQYTELKADGTSINVGYVDGKPSQGYITRPDSTEQIPIKSLKAYGK